MIVLLTIVHVIIAFVLILLVLLQSSKGGDVAGAFGGMGSQTAFGPQGTTTFLSKTTAGLAVAFMLTSMALAIISNQSRGTGGSILGGEQETAAPQSGPASPVAPLTTTTPEVQVIPPPSAPAPDATPAPADTPPASGTLASPPAANSPSR